MKRISFKRLLKRFNRNDCGAVTVDWVVITAGIVALGISLMSLIGTEAESLATSTGTKISDQAK